MSPDDSATLIDVKKTQGMLITALAAITTQVDLLSQGKALQVATISAQPGTRAEENPTATPSASFHLNMAEQVQMQVEHWARTAHTPVLDITDDETGWGGGGKDPSPQERHNRLG